MLILLLRIVFVVLAVLIGSTSGQYFYRVLFFFDQQQTMPVWFGGAMGFGIAITLIAAEQGFRRRFNRSLVAFLIGLAAGLLLALLMLSVLHLVIQDENIYRNLDLPLATTTIYLVLITVLRSADRFRVVVPFVEFRSEKTDAGALVLDAEVLADGRLAGLVKAGVFPNRLLVHRLVLQRCEERASDADPTISARGRRALEGLAELRALPAVKVEIDETEIPNAANLGDILVRLARLDGARLLAGDEELTRRAAAEGISIIDLNALAATLAPQIRPGEAIGVRIDKPGEGRNQGVGFLDDGSMVIVSDAADAIGQRVQCTVMRLHTTSNGRMVFAERIKP